MKSGLITDIQRFSLNDGPGIRTTVFFKGCNMRCEWCHNPETICHQKEIMFYANKCIGCGKCFEICPAGVHKAVDGIHVIDREKCTLCGKCVENCYAEALVFSAKEMTSDEIMGEILQDKVYYTESNGGVTLSGGEVTCQKDFALELVEKCKENGIKTAVETNLLMPLESTKDLLSSLDLIMFDIKIFDNGKHKEHTGVPNTQILENAKKLDELGVPFIVRTPLIPGVTDDEENLVSIAKFLSPFKNILYYELLNFNPLGSSKYKSLDGEDKFENARPFTNEALKALEAKLSGFGVKIKVGG
ncbi:MAG: glycyl-radical enzyme activating protein [Clostridia bacterium]|nr:glycyl-radical enzyme activating protein [Clostridia bacterium]